ncbi:MAG: tetratricopeptide repeat protein [Terracidiphilus sp.]|jgi:tetratricopeptide (TPR) repeat protein
MLKNAIKHHQQGRLADAERIYRQILAIEPRHADSLHLLGTLAHQVGRDDVAAELIRAAIATNHRQPAYHSNLGTILQAQGDLVEAAACYRRALALKPDLAEAQMNLGTVLETQGRLEEAASRFKQALALKPDLAEAHVNLGNILQSQGRLDEAVASFERALALKPGMAEVHGNLGNALQAQMKLDGAVACYEQALALKPEMAEVHGNLGNALQAQKKLDDAVACYERALALKPDYAEACYNLGNARQAQDKLSEAAACYERALKLKPQLPEAHYNLGNTRQAQDRLDEAAACFERALAHRPEYAEAHYNLACVLQALGRLPEALAHYRRAIELQPDYAQARFGQALAQLLHGDFESGWRNYEARWQSIDHDTPMRPYPQPLWTGERLAHGRLLLWAEQGVGDEIMFAGLVPDAIRTGNPMTLDCDPRLKPLFARSFPAVEVVSARDQGPVLGADSVHPVGADSVHPAETEIAAHLPTGSLPGLFRATEPAFAATTLPYLKADAAERNRFRARYGEDRRLVGLAWYTRNQRTGRKRSIPLSLLASEPAPLLALPGIRWISLQYGDFDSLEQQAAAAQATIPHAPILIDRTVDQFADMDLFAAQVAAMDLVITIDNSTAHLAGALGIPVWLMLPFAADWRWLETRQDSPWYPTMRLFRQPNPGDWRSVVESVQWALGKSCAR